MKIIKKFQTILKYNKIDIDQSRRYYTTTFQLEENAAQLCLEITQDSKDYAQLPIALYFNEEAIILKASDGQKGNYKYVYLIGERENTPGSIQGTLEKGEYTLVIYKRRMVEDIPIVIEVSAEKAEQFIKAEETTFDQIVKNKNPGWYRGELHVHSSQSTGRVEISTLLEFCTAHNIDFIAITDHFTASHWQAIQKAITKDSPLCLKSVEISGDKGHMNAHGLTHWLNPLVDDNENLPFKEKPSMTSIAKQVHKMGGFVSVNHPLSGLVSWHYPDFDMKEADALEIWCTADYQTTFLYPTFWDQYLKQGLHLTGIGSSDSHHPTAIDGWLMGNIFTVVKARELSQKAIIEGIKQGHCYVAMGSSQLRFYAKDNNNTYEMGDTIKGEEDVTFFVELITHPSGHLIIYRDGFQETCVYFEQGECNTYTFTIPKFKYCRIEFHEDLVKTRFWGMVYRDYKSMRLLSNPIWHE